VYLSSVIKLGKDKKVYVIGMKGLEEELREEGFDCLGGTVSVLVWKASCAYNPTQDPADHTLEPFDLTKFTLDPDVGAVVCGIDKFINYTKLAKAFQYLTRIPGCLFIVTNEDSTYPTPGGVLPGGGAISAPLRYAVRDPISTGKPSATMLDCIMAK
jgi:4-nitrophenyl phosphatase